MERSIEKLPNTTLISMAGTTCFFAHFNAMGRIDSYVYAYLDHLSALGINILFISNSPIRKEDRLALEKIRGVYRIEERENKGNDLGAWQWALAKGMLPEEADRLLLTNDSIFGPLFSLEPLFRKMDADPSVDFWGLTDSYQGGWHLQSYFVSMNRKTFSSDAFRNVLSQDFSTFDKKTIIEKGEIGLSANLAAAGFKGAACFPYHSIDPDHGGTVFTNPTHAFWEPLIRKFRFPFLKKELILVNPERLQDVGDAFAILEKETDYPVEYIKQCIIGHLAVCSGRNAGFPWPAEGISVLCHLYYPGTIYYFLSKLAVLRSPGVRFFINLSASLIHNKHFMDILTFHFGDAIIFHSPSQGRDIGGKMVGLDSMLRSGVQTGLTLVIHDKISPHTPTGTTWSNDLLKIIDPGVLPGIFGQFDKDRLTGVVTSGNFIKNEYNPDKGNYTCTSSNNLVDYIKAFDMTVTNHNFAAGTIFWIRTGILRDFFSRHSPLSIRRDLEAGNALDFTKGTNTHSWERLFSFIANSQGYKTTGVS